MRRQFLAVLRRELESHGLSCHKSQKSEIIGLCEKLMIENPVDQSDKAGTQHQKIACLMLAAYRTLKISVEDHELMLDILCTALTKPNSWMIRNATRVMLFFSKDPMTTLVNYTKNRVPPMYGNVFEFTNEEKDRNEFTMRITSCYYHNFFVTNGAIELTPLFCAWDKNWIEPISPTKHGVKFQRKTTLATGGDSCPFTFVRLS